MYSSVAVIHDDWSDNDINNIIIKVIYNNIP